MIIFVELEGGEKSTKAAQLDELGHLLLTKKLNEKGHTGKKL
jgi:hypothetical protein